MILSDKQIACLPTSPMAGVAARQPLFFYLNGLSPGLQEAGVSIFQTSGFAQDLL